MGSLAVACRLGCPVACGILVPWPGIKPTSPALEGRFLITGHRGSPSLFFYVCRSRIRQAWVWTPLPPLTVQLIGAHCLHGFSPFPSHCFFLQGRTFSFESNSLFFIVLVSLELFSKPPWGNNMKNFKKFPSQLFSNWLKGRWQLARDIFEVSEEEKGTLLGSRPQPSSSFMVVMVWNRRCLGWRRVIPGWWCFLPHHPLQEWTPSSYRMGCSSLG